MGTRIWRIVACAALVATAVSCAEDEFGGSDITVLAAASLTEAMTEIANDFEESTGRKALVSFGPSSGLVTQIQEGAPVDVFASADQVNMEKLVASGDIAGSPRPFAKNRLMIAVPPGNPKGITGFADLARGDIIVGLCAAPVPCGRLAREAATKAGVTPAVDSDEPDVRSLLTKLQAGEVDVGVVYVTDVRASGGMVDGVPIPDEHNVVTTYPIATLARSKQKKGADDFVGFVRGQGAQLLGNRGFEAVTFE